MPLQDNKVLHPLYLITDRKQTCGRPLMEVLQESLAGGVKMVQLREKDLSGMELFDLALNIRDLTNRYEAKLLINDRIDIALAVEADGVHLPSNSFSVSGARKLLGHDKIIGLSTHTVEEAERAEKEGADFITFSPIFYTKSKTNYGKPQGLEKLKKVCGKTTIPIYALGGINEKNVPETIDAGAFGVAMISTLISAPDVKEETEKILSLSW